MSKITAEEFWKLWDSCGEGEGAIFQLSSEQIQEWIKRGKFSKIKEYCQQLPYDVKFVCLKPTCDLYEKSFGFIFQDSKDSSRLLQLNDELLKIRSCIKVQGLIFDELPTEWCSDIKKGGIGVLEESFCPLVI